MLLMVTKPTQLSNIKKACYNFGDGVALNKHNTIYTNDNVNVSKINKLVSFNDNNYFMQKIKHTQKEKHN